MLSRPHAEQQRAGEDGDCRAGGGCRNKHFREIVMRHVPHHACQPLDLRLIAPTRRAMPRTCAVFAAA